jgi:hypothetical protein
MPGDLISIDIRAGGGVLVAGDEMQGAIELLARSR